MKKLLLLALGASTLTLSACTSEDLAAFSEGLAQASYDMQYNNPTMGYYGSPYVQNSGTWVGYNQCQHTGTFYTCDTNGDGWADMYGDSADGSYASSSLRVNGRGEAFTWNSSEGEWERNRAYDGPRRDDDHHHHGHRRDHD